MLPLSTAPVQVRPKGNPKSVYHVAPATLLGRIKMERDVVANGFTNHSDETMRGALVAAGARVLPANAHKRLIDILGAKEAGLELDENAAEALIMLENQVLRSAPDYAALIGDRRAYIQALPIFAFKHFVVGWDGCAIEFRAGPDGVAEDTMTVLPPDEVTEIGWEAWALSYVPEAAAKKSASPSPSPASPRPSPAKSRGTAGADGSSEKNSTNETPPAS